MSNLESTTNGREFPGIEEAVEEKLPELQLNVTDTQLAHSLIPDIVALVLKRENKLGKTPVVEKVVGDVLRRLQLALLPVPESKVARRPFFRSKKQIARASLSKVRRSVDISHYTPSSSASRRGQQPGTATMMYDGLND